MANYPLHHLTYPPLITIISIPYKYCQKASHALGNQFPDSSNIHAACNFKFMPTLTPLSTNINKLCHYVVIFHRKPFSCVLFTSQFSAYLVFSLNLVRNILQCILLFGSARSRGITCSMDIQLDFTLFLKGLLVQWLVHRIPIRANSVRNS